MMCIFWRVYFLVSNRMICILYFVLRMRMRMITNSYLEQLAGQSLRTLSTLLSHLEKDIMAYFESSDHTTAYTPSPLCHRYSDEILFPFQVYLFSQAEGDTAGERTESIILEGYVMQLVSLCARVLSKAKVIIRSNPGEQPILMTSLQKSPLDLLLPYVLSLLYMGNFSMHIAECVRTDLIELTQAWCSLLTICGMDVWDAIMIE